MPHRLEQPHKAELMKLVNLETRLDGASSAFKRAHGLSHDDYAATLMPNNRMRDAVERIAGLQSQLAQGKEYWSLWGAAIKASITVHLLATEPALFPQAAALANRSTWLRKEERELNGLKHKLGDKPPRSLELAEFHSRKRRWLLLQTNVLKRMHAVYAEKDALVAQLDAQCCPYSQDAFRRL